MNVSLFLGLIFLSTSFSQAALYSGIISQADPHGFQLKETKLKKTYTLSFTNPNIEKLVQKLKVQDFISVEGTRNSKTNTIRVHSLKYVGLKDLLSIWNGNDNYCYNFTSFTQLLVYPSVNSAIGFDCPVMVANARKYAYTVSPSEPDWVLLLSDNHSNFFADLVIKDQNTAEISLYDTNTGGILRSIILKR